MERPGCDPSDSPFSLSQINQSVSAKGQNWPVGFDRWMNVTYYNADSVNDITISVRDSQGNKQDFTIAAGSNDIIKHAWGNRVEVSGPAASKFSLVASWPAEFSPGALVALQISSVNISGQGRTPTVSQTSVAYGPATTVELDYTVPAGFILEATAVWFQLIATDAQVVSKAEISTEFGAASNLAIAFLQDLTGGALGIGQNYVMTLGPTPTMITSFGSPSSPATLEKDGQLTSPLRLFAGDVLRGLAKLSAAHSGQATLVIWGTLTPV